MPGQRVLDSTNGTVDAAGQLVAEFPASPLGYVQTGAVTSLDSATTDQWRMALNSAARVIGYFTGKGPFSPVQVWGGETLFIVGVGLTPGSRYRFTFIGLTQPEVDAQPLSPIALATPIPVA